MHLPIDCCPLDGQPVEVAGDYPTVAGVACTHHRHLRHHKEEEEELEQAGCLGHLARINSRM